MKRENEKLYRVNGSIKFSPVVVIDHNGRNLGPTALQEARIIAEEAGLDLVEISPNSRPPVCRVMDFGKFKFEQNLKEKKQRRKQKQSVIKEVRLSPSIQDHDLDTKSKAAMKFLSAGHRVVVKLEFKRRELAHKDLGITVMDSFLSRIKDHGIAPDRPRFEGRNLSCVVDPKNAQKD